MAYNVPVVNEGLPARISKPQVCRVAKLWRSEAWEWRSHDLAERKPSRFSGEAFTILLCEVRPFFSNPFLYLIFSSYC
jgi:hypothetical protein